MAKRTVSVRDRILAVASDLFRKQGYSETGINQILEESSSARASFYQHFPSKEDLGIAYLRESYGAQQFELLDYLKKRNPHPRNFMKSWVRVLKMEARRENLYGCAMANLRAQTFAISPILENEVRTTANRILDSLADFIEKAKELGFMKQEINSALMARRLFSIYEGVIHVYKLTGNPAAIDDLLHLGEIVINNSSVNEKS
jgi:AcrR family transcriptional regulator